MLRALTERDREILAARRSDGDTVSLDNGRNHAGIVALHPSRATDRMSVPVLVVTRGHWRSIETVPRQELELLTCIVGRSDKKLGNRCSIP